MRIGSALQSAAVGMDLARTKMDGHAHAIANVSSEDVVSVDLPLELVGTIIASHAYDVNARVFGYAADTQRSLFDALA